MGLEAGSAGVCMADDKTTGPEKGPALDQGSDATEAAQAQVPGVWSFTLETVSGQAQSFSIDESKLAGKGSCTVGRNPKSSDEILTDFSISREHCSFSFVAPGHLKISDLGSTNGTFVNEARLNPNEPADLTPGDQLEIGNLELKIEYEGGEDAAAPAAPVVTAEPASSEAVAARPAAAPAAEVPAKEAAAAAVKPKRASSNSRPTRSRGASSTGGRMSNAWIGRFAFAVAIILGVFAVVFGGVGDLPFNGYQLIGATIIAAILLQVSTMAWGSMQRTAAERAYFEEQTNALRNQVRLSSAHARAEQDRASMTWNGVRKYRIDRKVPEGGGICSFYLKPHDGKGQPPFEPGQYLTFQLKIPGEDKAIIRCYSLSDSPLQRDYYRVSIKAVPPPRDKPELPPGRSSNFFHDQLEEGDILDVKAPSGKFYMDTTKHTPVVLIGGGIGLTPVLSMLNTIILSGSKREVHFFYGVRNGAEHVMKEHLAQIDRENENVHMHICYSNPEPDEVEGTHFNHPERVSVALFKKILPSNNFDFYICGPPPMMESLVKDLDEWGVPEPNVHFEAFGPASVKKAKPKPAEDAGAAPAQTFEVEFAKSGKKIAWDGSHDSILEFAEANGVAMDSGCRAGNCGTCITAMKSGDVKYIEEPGAAPESGSCLTCVSVPKSNLVLEA